MPWTLPKTSWTVAPKLWTEPWYWCIVTPLLMEHNFFCCIWEFLRNWCLHWANFQFTISLCTIWRVMEMQLQIQNNLSIIACRVTLCFCFDVVMLNAEPWETSSLSTKKFLEIIHAFSIAYFAPWVLLSIQNSYWWQQKLCFEDKNIISSVRHSDNN